MKHKSTLARENRTCSDKLMPTLDPKIYKTIVFVRHGQYTSEPTEKLTEKGRAQAKLAAKVIKEINPDKLFASTMPRAIETATYIESECGMKAVQKDFLREGILPGLESVTKLTKAHHVVMKANKLKADKAYEFLFKAPKKSKSSVVVVAHGNVIRYWVCKALGIDPKKWVKMDLEQCSITTIRVDNKGYTTLLGFADMGHIPRGQRTYL